MKSRHRIKSKLRFCISLSIMLIILFSAVGNVAGYGQALSMTKPEYTEITVITGDTLWDLAKTYGPDDKDIRKVVHAICIVNDISPDRLQSGQKILIPKYL
ncbi:hypothetical protein MASR2M70_01750 [Bacillota bacterium]